jgi:CubicO group peptidase (beta-lactamase class C family)
VRVLGKEIPVTINDRFHLGSGTKAMTATLAGMLVDARKLRWSSTIGEVLGTDVQGINQKLAAVTLEQLLSHSGGIPSDNEEIAKLYTSPDAYDYNLHTQRLRILEAWRDHDPKTPSGSPFQYSNLGYIIAGTIIETAAGVPWEQLMYTRIYEPLGLRTAGLGAQATLGLYDAAVGHRVDEQGKVTPVPWGPAADNPIVVGPAGIAHMSILDFARWAAWNAGQGKRGPTLVKPETLAVIHQAHVASFQMENAKPGMPTSGAYALGWGILKFDWTAKPVLTHDGSNQMNFATILVDTDNDIAIVVTTNFPGDKAKSALLAVTEQLYKQYAPRR